MLEFAMPTTNTNFKELDIFAKFRHNADNKNLCMTFDCPTVKNPSYATPGSKGILVFPCKNATLNGEAVRLHTDGLSIDIPRNGPQEIKMSWMYENDDVMFFFQLVKKI